MKYLPICLISLHLSYSAGAQSCINVSGSWSGTENVKLTIYAQGRTETVTRSGSASFTIRQSGCGISFNAIAPNPFGGGTISLPRTGSVQVNRVTFSGAAAVRPPGLNIQFSQNSITANCTVSGSVMKCTSSGKVVGTLDGVAFTVDLSSTATFYGNRVPVPPLLTRQPVDQTVIVDCPVTFRSRASGLGQLKYQWKFNETNIKNATNAVYSIPAVKFTSAGDYRVVVRNFDGATVSQPATLTVVTNPFLPVKGAYHGLFYESSGVLHESSGFFKMNLGDKGAYKATIYSAGKTNVFNGQFDFGGRASQSVARPGKSPLLVNLELDLVNGTDQLQGNISDGVWTSQLVANRALFNTSSNPATNYSGRYTLIIPGDGEGEVSPKGDGWGVVRVDAGGIVSLTGKLADGSPISQVVPLSKNGEWPLYASLYRGLGSIMSWITITPAPDQSASGLLSWVRPTIVGARYYPIGFSNDVEIVSSTYNWAPANQVLNLSNGQVIFCGGNLGDTPLTNSVLLSANNRVTNTSTNRMAVTINPTNGLFSGYFKVPGTKQTNLFSGVLLQNENVGRGFFLGTNQSGQVLLQAAP